MAPTLAMELSIFISASMMNFLDWRDDFSAGSLALARFDVTRLRSPVRLAMREFVASRSTTDGAARTVVAPNLDFSVWTSLRHSAMTGSSPSTVADVRSDAPSDAWTSDVFVVVVVDPLAAVTLLTTTKDAASARRSASSLSLASSSACWRRTSEPCALRSAPRARWSAASASA